MPNVQTSVHLGDCSKAHVWPILIDLVRYPEFMADVLEVTVDSREGPRMVSTWRVLLNGSELTWTERDILVFEDRIEFEQIDGDLEIWEGCWQLMERSDGLHVQLDVRFDIGIPSLADVLHPMGERAIRANIQQMLEGIRDMALSTRA
jgi:ribosome-associated toxin RatA of RatAB toxin-antitoxin module